MKIHPFLAPYAAQDNNSLGRQYSESVSAYRSEYQRDAARIMHCTAFRRLEHKTQVFTNNDGDVFRTRLTHALEVAQISRVVARALHLNEDLAEAVALAHDLGYPPFGQVGQETLHRCMQPYGGFEHNWQGLRIVDELEECYPQFRGLNLTFETREGILKYCHPQRAKYLGSVGARFLKTPIGLPSLEAQIAHICNGIAHNTYEIDDGLRAKVISIRQLREYTLFAEHHDAVMKKFPLISQRRAIHEIIRQIINAQVDNLVDTSHEHLEAVQPQNIAEIRDTEDPLITFSATMYEKHLDLKQFLHTQMYQHYRVRRMAFKAQHVIQQLFEAFFSDACLLPLEAQMEVQRLQAALGTELGKTRAIADYIAGMTDRHAIVEHERLFNPQMMPFDKIY